MATLTELYNFSNDTTFQGQVKAAAIKAALNILGEVTTGQTATVVNKRQTLAYNVLKNLFNLPNWSLAVAANIDSITPTETQINTAIASIWNDMAGIITGE